MEKPTERKYIVGKPFISGKKWKEGEEYTLTYPAEMKPEEINKVEAERLADFKLKGIILTPKTEGKKPSA